MTTETDAAATSGVADGDVVVTACVGVVGAVSVHAARTVTDASVRASGLRIRAPNEAVGGVSADEVEGSAITAFAAFFARSPSDRGDAGP
jgi:hypothetical protein